MNDFPVSPGPWEFGYTDDLQTPIIVDANDDVVCVMHEGVTTKDGKLMAAAPELLQSLIDLEAMADRYRPDGYPIPDAQKTARAAIAKATGGAA